MTQGGGGDPTGTYEFVAIPIFGIWWTIAGVPDKVYKALEMERLDPD